jgi:hypothetical protein
MLNVKKGVTAIGLATLSVSALSAEFSYKLESKVNYRDSDENRFPTAFPFPPSFLPVGQSSAFLETVDVRYLESHRSLGTSFQG